MSFLLSISVSSVSHFTFMPTGVAEICSTSSFVPTVPCPGSRNAATLLQAVSSASAITAGVANTGSSPLPIACAVNSFVTTCSLFPLIPVVSTVFSNPEQLKAAPCFSACNCSSELEPGQSCGTLTSVVIYKPASLIIYLDRSDRLMWNSPRLPLHFTTKNAGRHEKELSPLCHAEADASERRLKCRKYQDFMVS